ncbi:MAG: branched-chain amino acid transporter permease [Desertimonas sp.]|nr:branched-chain amino acid transporter permease [Desertimonas sp.]
MYKRPALYTNYQSETSILPTWTQRISAAAVVTLAVLLPFSLPVINQIPFIRYLGDPNWLRILTQAVVFAIAALGLNLLTGTAGQVSLGHSFFMGVGAYTAAVIGGEPGGRTWGLGLPIWVWLPAAGIGAAAVGLLIGPAAVRVRGLYLGIVTIGLVFIGIHLSRVFPEISGPAEIGRDFPPLQFSWWKGPPVISFEEDGNWLWFDISGEAKSYLFMLAMLGVAIVLAKNLVRTRTGRALQAIRDRDVAAEIMGVPEVRYKLIAFAISSCFAGIAGALFASFIGRLPPEYWSLILAVEFIAIILIGGAGTIAGAILGTFFVVLLPQNLENFVHWMSEQAAGTGLWAAFWDLFVSSGTGDFGFVSDAQIAPGFPLPSSALDAVLYGLLVIIFLLFEPRGLFGIWVKIRNYWKGWPFTY